MEVFSHVFLQMLVLGTAVVIGVIARKLHFMNDEVDTKLSQIIMTFTIPALILDSVLSNTNLPSFDSLVLALVLSAIASALICLLAVIVVRVFFRGTPKYARGAYEYIISFGNTGQIGFAVLAVILGDNGVLYGAICNISYTIFCYSFGTLFVLNTVKVEDDGQEKTEEELRAARKHRSKEIIKQLISPCLISSIVAMFLALFGITDTEGYCGQTCELVGGIAIPASMIVIGSTLAKMNIKEVLSDFWSYVASVLRLLGAPLLVYFLGSFFVTDHMVLAVLVIQAGMPAAVAGIMMSLAYGGDSVTMTRGTFITTVLSLFTLPFICMLVV